MSSHGKIPKGLDFIPIGKRTNFETSTFCITELFISCQPICNYIRFIPVKLFLKRSVNFNWFSRDAPEGVRNALSWVIMPLNSVKLEFFIVEDIV